MHRGLGNLYKEQGNLVGRKQGESPQQKVKLRKRFFCCFT